MRTDAEVTAAAERTADLALRCVELTRQRDRARDIAVALEGQGAAVRALHAPEFWRIGRTRGEDERIDGISDGQSASRTDCKHCRTAWPCDTLAALDPAEGES